ncbi:DUF3224 domain-containing protein [Thermomonospora umbrina]|uniref:Uncharacterized protein DUF3224 n=1 Tax=Thermomonospora umbrina TaxID=111806 RepID=A0A3D9SSV7_9ACTN|nr:DUF3224 domain-containing protein [Thermomonospora umbrina]REE99059.1 uncharacterized protein DUF3224 [Thermomonospora umbrina]
MSGLRHGLTLAAGLLVAVAAVSTRAAASPAAGAGDGGRIAEGTFKVVSFTNEPFKQLEDGTHLSRFAAVDAFEGGIQGRGEAEATMYNRPDGSARDVGYIHVVGTLDGRSGGFVLETVGRFDGESVTATWKIVPGSGTGELRGLRGHGTETAAPTDDGWLAHYRLTYYLG